MPASLQSLFPLCKPPLDYPSGEDANASQLGETVCTTHRSMPVIYIAKEPKVNSTVVLNTGAHACMPERMVAVGAARTAA